MMLAYFETNLFLVIYGLIYYYGVDNIGSITDIQRQDSLYLSQSNIFPDVATIFSDVETAFPPIQRRQHKDSILSGIETALSPLSRRYSL